MPRASRTRESPRKIISQATIKIYQSFGLNQFKLLPNHLNHHLIRKEVKTKNHAEYTGCTSITKIPFWYIRVYLSTSVNGIQPDFFELSVYFANYASYKVYGKNYLIPKIFMIFPRNFGYKTSLIEYHLSVSNR